MRYFLLILMLVGCSDREPIIVHKLEGRPSDCRNQQDTNCSTVQVFSAKGAREQSDYVAGIKNS